MLYYEIDVAETFSKGLGQEIGMKLSATKTFDLFLGYVSQAYCHYHVLPEDKFAAFQRVIEVLEEAAIKYKKKYSRIPVIFIDGVDILAKYNEQLCEVLVTLAKILANNNKVRLVLISSEGTIMPLLGRWSAMNRALIYEVGDLSREDATTYLTDKGVTTERL